ncbi:MAG: c-type cytochrome [Nitrospinales bacterium]
MKIDNYFKLCGFAFLIFTIISFSDSQAFANSAEEIPLDNRVAECPQNRKTLSAPEEFLKMKNPVQPTDENIDAGAKLFLGSIAPIPCTICHGVAGNGLGDPDFESTPSPRNFTCKETMENIPDGQLFWVIKSGVPRTAMPSFTELSDDQIWHLILYIRHLGK